MGERRLGAEAWLAKRRPGFIRSTAKTEVRCAEEPTDVESSSVCVLGGGSFEDGLEWLANGPLAVIAQENGEVTERGMERLKCAVKLLGSLLNGKKHGEAMAASGLQWIHMNTFLSACPEFKAMYDRARRGWKLSLGSKVLDTSMELATVGENVRDRNGKVIGKKRSEKMLDRLLVLSGDEFQKNSLGCGGKKAGLDNGGGVTFNLHFDGKRDGMKIEAERDGVKETLDVRGVE